MTEDRDDLGELHPVAQTIAAFRMLRAVGEDDLEQHVLDLGREVRALTPLCVALSVSLMHRGLTFTLAADGHASALMDAVQYLDGGPCLAAMVEPDVIATDIAVDGRGPRTGSGAGEVAEWRLFATAGAHLGIASSLSLPLVRGDEAVAAVNLYGLTRDAFEGREAQLAALCGAQARDAVSGADLAFTSRLRAAVTPARLAEASALDLAAGLVARLHRVDVTTAAGRIERAALRARISAGEFARFLLEAHQADIDDEFRG